MQKPVYQTACRPEKFRILFIDDSPAFRVEFDGPVPPAQERYWRGPVLWDFDGTTWNRSRFLSNIPVRSQPSEETAPYHYQVILEPHERRWLFALDYPAAYPRNANLSIDYTLTSKDPVVTLKRYTIKSDPRHVDTPKLSSPLRDRATQLPAGSNPRARALAAQWRNQYNDHELVNHALQHFNQEAFFYTLNPPLLGRHSVDEFLFDIREGYCEFYASAFTFLMRAAGIPARVVTGYQGGYYSDIGGYLLVRQSDAHAWAEVWLTGSGWVRIDPTAAVAPQRIREGSTAALNGRRNWIDFPWIRQMKK